MLTFLHNYFEKCEKIEIEKISNIYLKIDIKINKY